MRIRVLKPPNSCALGLLDLVCVPHSRKPRVVSDYDTFLRKDVLLFHSRAKISNFNQMEMRNWGILWCVCPPWQKQLWFCWWMGALGLGFNGMIWRIPIMCLLYVAMRLGSEDECQWIVGRSCCFLLQWTEQGFWGLGFKERTVHYTSFLEFICLLLKMRKEHTIWS